MKKNQVVDKVQQQESGYAMVSKRIAILILLGLSLGITGYGQFFNPTENLRPEFDMPDLEFKGMLNYKDSTAHLSDFKGKLVILDYWGPFCETCIEKFPLEDSLMAAFKDRLQFLLVCDDFKSRQLTFLTRWDSIHTSPLKLPMVTDSPDLRYYFPFYFMPTYVWLLPNGKILGETSAYYVQEKIIRKVLENLETSKQTSALFE